METQEGWIIAKSNQTFNQYYAPTIAGENVRIDLQKQLYEHQMGAAADSKKYLLLWKTETLIYVWPNIENDMRQDNR